MKLKETEILISIISCYISLLILYFSGFFNFNIKEDNIYKIIPPIITASVAFYVAYEARKITKRQKEIAEDKLLMDHFEKKIVPYLLLWECLLLIIEEISLRKTSRYSEAVGDHETIKEIGNLSKKAREKFLDAYFKSLAYDSLYTDEQKYLLEKSKNLLRDLISNKYSYVKHDAEPEKKTEFYEKKGKIEEYLSSLKTTLILEQHTKAKS